MNIKYLDVIRSLNIKPLHLKSMLVGIGIILVTCILYLNNKSTSLQEYQQEIQLLRELRLLNALVDQELLTIRYRLVNNYDQLSRRILKLNNAHDSLNTLSKSNYPFINKEEIKSLSDYIGTKIDKIEEFKTKNSWLKNSLQVIPNLNTDLQIKLENFEDTDTVGNHVNGLLSDIYLYSLSNDNDNELDIKIIDKISRLEELQYSVSPEITPHLEVIHKHTSTIIQYRQEVNKIVDTLINLPLEHLINNLLKAYTSHNEQIVAYSNFYRIILFFLSILLLSVTAYILIKLRRKTYELEHEKNRAIVTLHSIGEGIITTDGRGIVQYINPVAEQLTGWKNTDAHGKHLQTIFHVYDERTSGRIKNLVERCIAENRHISSATQSVLVNRNTRKTAIEDTVAPIRGTNGEIIGTIIVFRDVSRTRELSRKLSYQASHDALTNVINRRAFEVQLTKAIKSAKHNNENHALLYLDLDQFKIVNDTCGHDAGDQLLIQVTSLLQSKLGKNDTLARLGGDEFGVLLKGCSLNDARDFAEILLAALKNFRFEWQSIHFQLGVSIGIAIIDKNSNNLVSAMSAADMACYVAKDTGRNRVYVYSQGNKELVRRRDEMQWVTKLTTAIKENRFVLFRQPIVPLCADKSFTYKYELLLRLCDADGTIIQPNEFIPAAERYNFMPTIDRWVIRTAFANLAKNNNDNEFYSINLSGTSLNTNTLLKYIKQEYKRHTINPNNICFEITETAAIKNLPKVAKLVKELKALGFKFALDDFGKGVSSFMYLSALPVDYLKIDGEFVKNLLNNTVNHAIIWSINNIGRILGIQIIAEYVENEHLHDALLDIGIDYAQGFKFGEPEPVANQQIQKQLKAVDQPISLVHN